MKRFLIILAIIFVSSTAFAQSIGNILNPVDRMMPSLLVLNRPSWIDVRVLAANTVEGHTVPTGAQYVLFSATADFYARYEGTAAVPATDVTDGTGSELNPVLRRITGVATISLISASACTITMVFFKEAN